MYGPKIGRNLTLFGETAVRAWTLLESDPQILSYCERPIVIDHAKPKRVIDFWARRGNRDELWILLKDSEIEAQDGNSFRSPSFQQWVASNDFELKLIDPGDLYNENFYFGNWGVILRYLSQNEKFVPAELTDQVFELSRAPTTLAMLERQLPEYDQVVVRTALFSLLHQGKMECVAIHTEPLGAQSQFVAI